MRPLILATLLALLLPAAPAHAARDPGSGRPTKKQRRDLDRLREGED